MRAFRCQRIGRFFLARGLQQPHRDGDNFMGLRRDIQFGTRLGQVTGQHPHQFGQFALSLG